MNKKPSFLMIDTTVLPEIFSKVVEAKHLISTGKCKTATEATAKLSISRSAYYKYKDYVFPFYATNQDRIITLYFELLDVTGVLSSILSVLAKVKANVLTINQNIPINGVANITISIRTNEMQGDIDRLINRFSKIEGMKRVEMLAKE